MSHAERLGNLRDEVVNDYIEQYIADAVQRALVPKNLEIDQLNRELWEANRKLGVALSEVGGYRDEVEDMRARLKSAEDELAEKSAVVRCMVE